MQNFSLIEKLRILMNLVLSSPLFLCCIMLAIALLIFFIINIKKDKKINSWMFLSIILLIILILLIAYNDVFLSLINDFLDAVFMALYFPNLATYMSILIISNFTLIYSLFSRKTIKINKIINVISTIILDVFLILIIDTVSRNNIDINDSLKIYSNTTLLVLLELSTAIFTSWILIKLFISAKLKLKKYDKKTYPKMPDIIFDDNNFNIK